MDYSDMYKADLVKECEARGLESDGLKSDLIARLMADDLEPKEEAKKPVAAKKKVKVWNPMLFRFEYK
jgi:hypothetical protein